MPVTIAKRHQFDVAAVLLRRFSTSDLNITRSLFSIVPVTLGENNDAVNINQNINDKWYQCRKIELNGTKYKVGCNLITVPEATNDLDQTPLCVLVFRIYVHSEKNIAKFYCEKLTTFGFEDHRHGWSVEFQLYKQYICIDPATLSYYLPLALRSVTYNGTELQLLVPRHRLYVSYIFISLK